MSAENNVDSLGLDLSLTGTGCVALTNGHIIENRLIKSKSSEEKTPKGELIRIMGIVTDAQSSIDTHKPSIVVIEGIAYGIVKSTALSQLSALNYLIRHVCFSKNIPFAIVAPNSLKKFVTGQGMCQKDVMMLETYKRWNVTFTENNQCDAYGLSQIGLALLGKNSKPITKFQEEVLKILRPQLV